MKALTIKNPWCSLITKGVKNVENRTWKTSYRGPILLHSSQRPLSFRNPNDIFTYEQWEGLDLQTRMDVIRGDENGAILGVAMLTDIRDDLFGKNPWALENNYHWVLENAEPLITPIPIKGKLNLWNVDMEEIDEYVCNYLLKIF